MIIVAIVVQLNDGPEMIELRRYGDASSKVFRELLFGRRPKVGLGPINEKLVINERRFEHAIDEHTLEASKTTVGSAQCDLDELNLQLLQRNSRL